jgi:hypothetical protein
MNENYRNFMCVDYNDPTINGILNLTNEGIGYLILDIYKCNSTQYGGDGKQCASQDDIDSYIMDPDTTFIFNSIEQNYNVKRQSMHFAVRDIYIPPTTFSVS